MNPGTTAICLASYICVLLPASAFMSAVVPTAAKLPAFTANASARGMAASTVYAFALKTRRSGSRGSAADEACGGCIAATRQGAPARPAIAAPVAPTNCLRVGRSLLIDPKYRLPPMKNLSSLGFSLALVCAAIGVRSVRPARVGAQSRAAFEVEEATIASIHAARSEERRVGKERRPRWPQEP